MSTTLPSPRTRVDDGAVEAVDVARVLGAGVPLLVGRIHVDLGTGTCQWSPEVELMHGPRPGRRPSLEALRSSLHPDDQERVAGAVVHSAQQGRPFAAAHRVVDAGGRTHTLVVVGGSPRADGSAIEGAVVDVTPAQHEAIVRERDGVVARAMVARAAVERATGALMALTGLDEAAAAQLLNGAAARADVSSVEAAHQLMNYLVPAQECTLDEVAQAGLDAVATVPRRDAALLARRKGRRA
ncbi:MAG: PAS domain-containing protein [Promicromonosporaceae bacterium]|nr:PAS domain-containing protein [Promicromonosporaceae bacterium]